MAYMGSDGDNGGYGGYGDSDGDNGGYGGYGDSGPGGSSGEAGAAEGGASPLGPGSNGGGYSNSYTEETPYTFNPAQDSQAANEALGYSPNSDYSGSVDYSGYGGSMSSFGRGLSDFAESPFGKVVKGFISMNPFGRAALAGYGLMNGASPVSTALGMLPGVGGALARTAYGAATSGNPGGSLGSTAGGMFGSNVGGALGSGIAGPMGGALGGMLGGMFGSNVGGQMGTQIGQAGTQPQGMSGDIAGGLAGLYGSYQANKAASANAGAVNNQISQLSNMYSQNSPYAQQLRQELARKDAAAGRNSQYGPREAQLQALLAAKASDTAGTIGKLSEQSRTANQAQQIAQGQMLTKLLRDTGAGNYIQRGLGSLFANNNTPVIPEAYQNNDIYGY